MQILNSVGLSLDLAGVFLLGFDLVKVQIQLRQSARQRISDAQSVVEISGTAASVAEGFRLDHRHYDWDEGQPQFFEGTFDASSAKESERAAQLAIRGMADSVKQLSELISNQARSDEAAASQSLCASYVGLALVCVGFGLQLASNILT